MLKTPTTYLILFSLIYLNGFCQNLKLKVEGFNVTENKIIDSIGYLKTHNNYNSIESETDSIQRKLYNIGYIESEITEIKKYNDTFFSAKFHLKNKYESIHIYYNSQNISTKTLNLISNKVYEDYFILNFYEVKRSLEFINSQNSKVGFPFAKLNLSNISIINSNTLKAELILNNNKRRTLNNIQIKGYDKFPKAFLKNYLKIKPNQIFDLKTIESKTQQLNNLNFANEIKPPEVLFSKDSTTLYLYIEKVQANTFDGFLGFGTNEETNNIEFDGYLNLNLTNNLNFGESLRLLYKSDENDQQTFEAEASIPYLFKSPLGIDLRLRLFRKDSSFTTADQYVRLNYQIHPKHKIYGGITSTASNDLISENALESISDYDTFFFSTAYQYISLNNYNSLFPIKTKIFVEGNTGNRKTPNSKIDQSLLNAVVFKIFNLNQRNSIYLRLNGGILISDNYFENELLRFGGINSIRGFEENSLFASLYGLTNTEYRFQVNSSIYIHSIIDFAYMENKLLQLEQKLYGYGFGFGVLTKAGLLRFNYANGKIEDSKFKLSNSKIHISLTSYF